MNPTDLIASQAAPNQALPPVLVYWRMLVQRRWLILAIVGSALIASVIYTVVATPQYTAATRIQVAREGGNVTDVESVEGEVRNDDQEFYQTQYQLLEARTLAERVARSLRLNRDKGFIANNDITVAGLDAFTEIEPGKLTRAQQEELDRKIVKALRDNLSISPIRQSSLIDISYTYQDPQLAADVANAWAREFTAATIDRRYASTAEARRILEARIAELRTRLEDSERNLVNFAANQEIITLSTEENDKGRTRTSRTLASSDLESLNAALNDAIAARIAAESAARQVSTSSASLSNLALNGLRERRAQISADYARITVQFEPEYPGARALKSQLESLDRSIEREESRIRESNDTNYRQAAQHERELRERVDALKSRLLDQQRAGIQYNIFQRDVDTYRQLYETLLQRYREIGVAGVGENNISIVDRAKAPDKPSSPSLPINLVLALVAGLGIAGLTVFALEQLDDRLEDPNDIARKIGLPLLGAIPEWDQDDLMRDLRDPKSQIAEAVVSIQTSLSFLTDHGVPKSFMLTSTRPSEGKSTTATALAISLARTGRRVLLVDADMRSPSVNELLALGNETGLSNYLSGAPGWQALVQTTDVERLWSLTTGPIPPASAVLLTTDRFDTLITEALGQFDNVVIDGPPVMGLADAPLLSQKCEGVLFVVESGGTRARGLLNAVGRMTAANAQMLGTVVTRFDQRRQGLIYGYGEGYGYGYGFKYGKEASTRASS